MKIYLKSISIALREFLKERDFLYGAALAFYATFSMVPVIYLITEVLGIVFGASEVREQVLAQLSDSMGEDVAGRVANFISNAGASESSFWSRLLSTVVLVFSSTAIFYSVQDSLNKLWKLPYVSKMGIRRTLVDRFTSLLMLLGLGLLFVFSFVLETTLMSLVEVITNWFPKIDYLAISISQHSFALFINTLIFTVMFKVLPYARVPWKVTFTGGVFTAVIFHISQQIAVYYLGNASLTTTYGAASAIVFILAFVFISSQVFYLGAKFTQVYARESGKLIVPKYRE